MELPMKKLLALACAALLGVPVFAQDAKVETVVSGLTNPCGVAIQPETGHVFVADSGAGRVVRIVDGKIEEVIKGSPKDIYGKGPMYDVGPMGLAFLDKDTLVVGDGGYKDGEEFLRVYTVPAAGSAPLDYEKDAQQKSGPIAATDELKPEGNLYALAVTKNAIFVTCNGDDTKGWISKAELSGTKLGELQRSIATKEATNVDAPVGITVSSEGHLVVGQMGEINLPNDSLLTFYSAKDGKMLMNLKTNLFDISGLAYSPTKKLLYATDFAWMKTEDGGLYRLDKSGADAVKAVKIASLDKPTAVAFAADGTCYLTVLGTAKEEGKPAGALVKIAPGL
jgi:DNA-binding beta-propeller fold protein YncE